MFILKVLSLISIYIAYLLPDFMWFLLLLVPSIYGLKPIQLNLFGLFIFMYILIIILFSFIFIEGRFIFNIVSSSKLVFFLIYFMLLINCDKIFYLHYDKMESRYITLSWIIVFASLVLFLATGSTDMIGHRGDIGVFITLFCFFHVSRFTANPSVKNFLLTLSFLVMIILLLQVLQGRTAYGVLTLIVICGALHGRKTSGKSFLGLLLPTSIVVIFIILQGIDMIAERGGWEYLVNSEARLLALFYWYDAISGTSWVKFLFGHGYGQCVDQLTGYSDFVKPHVEQIISSSGGNCYVSWGFHNAFLSLIYEIGVVGTLFLLVFIWHCLSRSDTMNTFYKLLFLCLLIVASPNNHIFNHDIFAILILAATAYFYNTSSRVQKKHQKS